MPVSALDLEGRAKELLRDGLSASPPRLDRVALGVAAFDNAALDEAACLEALNSLAARVEAAADGGSTLQRLQALSRVLGAEEGFRGNRTDYFAPENSFLDRVLETRRGLPITLSVLYVEVARRAGIPLFGVPFPAHFVVGAALEDGSRVALDPFAGGQLLSAADCQALLERVSPGARFSQAMIVAAPVKAIALRMLNNLKRVYVERGDVDRTLRAVDLLLAVEPDHPGELRARAHLFAAMGAFRAAIKDLERCLEVAPNAPDRAELERVLHELRGRTSRLN